MSTKQVSFWRSVTREPALIVWALYLVLVPFYVFKSGLPQPGDMFIIVLIPVALRGWNRRLPRAAMEPVRALLWFTIWVFAVDYAWALIEGNWGLVGMDTFILFPVYYIYNFFIFLVALVLYQRFGDVFLRLTVYIVAGTVYLQVLSSFVLRSASFRGSLFFNNPNQLGYYALLAACLIALTHRRLQAKLVWSSVGLISCGYLALVSASRAAAAGIAILMILMVLSNPRIIIITSILALALIAVGGPIADAIDSSQQRALVTRNRDFLEERGYDRIWTYPQYLVLGAGEGGLTRFAETSTVQNMEIHSSAGMILFSYGFVGVFLFLAYLWRVVRKSSFRIMLILIPPAAYTIAHQGMRFSMLWVLLAIFIAVKQQQAPPARRPAPAR